MPAKSTQVPMKHGDPLKKYDYSCFLSKEAQFKILSSCEFPKEVVLNDICEHINW